MNSLLDSCILFEEWIDKAPQHVYETAFDLAQRQEVAIGINENFGWYIVKNEDEQPVLLWKEK